MIALLALVVKCTSRGPAIYSQVRVGRRGKVFKMFKLRSMVQDAEGASGAVWSKPNDPRTTRVGRLLRRAHLDELPQLWNVLKGEMSLVGPRPERPEFTQLLAREVPGYINRLAVLPGITGLAQVNLPPDVDINCVRRKLVLDLEYVQQANCSLDLRLLAYSCLRILRMPEHMLIRLLQLHREVTVPTLLADDEPFILPTPTALDRSVHGRRGRREPVGAGMTRHPKAR